jgi:anti-sigma factor RsiW
MTELSDELLVAYVDGQLARRQSSAVERVLEQDDVIARRVEALKDAHSRLEAAFDAILAGEEAVVSVPEPQAPGFYLTWNRAVKIALAGAGIVASLVLMIAGYGWPLRVPDLGRSSQGLTDPEYTGSIAPSWQETAARAQGLLSRESLEVRLENQNNPDFIAFELGQAIGPSLNLPNLDAQGYRVARAQMLRFEEQPLVQLLYLGTRGAPLALYVKKSAGTENPVFKRYGGIGSVAWSENGFSYLVAGEADEPALMKLADAIRSEPQDNGGKP